MSIGSDAWLGGRVFLSFRMAAVRFLVIILLWTNPASGEELHPASVSDVLSVEGIGAAHFSKDGVWLAYNVLPPYDQIHDYSYYLYAPRVSGHQIWIKNLAQDRAPRRQPGLDDRATNYLFDISPDSKVLVVLEHRLGRLRFVSCRIGRNKCVRFDAMPDIRDMYVAPSRWNERLVWTSNETFVMPVRPGMLPGSEMRSRGITGQFLWTEWNKAWAGGEPTASEAISTNRDRSEDWATGDLVEFNVRSGATRSIATARFAGARSSPDRRYVVAAKVGERHRPTSGSDLKPNETHPRFDRRYALHLIDLSNEQVQAYAEPFNIDPHSITWARDSKRFAVFGWGRDESSSQGRFYIFSITSDTSKVVEYSGHSLANSWLQPDAQWELGPARFALTDEGIIAFARPKPDARYDWFLLGEDGSEKNLSASLPASSGHPLFADQRSIVILAQDGAYRIPTKGGYEKLTPDRQLPIRKLAYTTNLSHAWSFEFQLNTPVLRNEFEDSGALVVGTMNSPGDREVIFLNYALPEASATHMEVPFSGAAVLAASEIARSVVVSVKEGASTRLLLLRDNASPVLLTHINKHLDRIAHPKKMFVQYSLNVPSRGAEKRNITGCVLLPHNFQAGARYPLVIEVYPAGGAAKCETLEDAARPGSTVRDLWTTRGFIYMWPETPLDLVRSDDGPLSGLDDVLDQTIDALVSEGLVDPQRVVLFGFSQGGVSSLYVATQSRKFSAVISMNGWSDFFSHYFGSRGLMRYFHLDQNGGDNRWRYECMGSGEDNYCPFGFGTTPMANPSAYAANSPVALAEDVKAPLMLIHSDLDYFGIEQYDEMFGALYRAGKEARYVRYWGEGHGPSSPANIRDLWERIDSFLDESGLLPSPQVQPPVLRSQNIN